MLDRIVAAEILDHLAHDDPAAMRSRRDLRRVHRAMGTRSIVVRALKEMTASWPRAQPIRILELGAGDGSLMLGVARALAHNLPKAELSLLDRQKLIDQTMIESYAGLGWAATAQVVDVLDWAKAHTGALRSDEVAAQATLRWDFIIANLFMHHFESAQLALLFEAIAARTNRFFACEPRRDGLSLVGSHLIGVLGANAVTRADAVSSVHAGFRGKELSVLWPASNVAHQVEWRLQEYSSGLFSHCFRAERIGSS